MRIGEIDHGLVIGVRWAERIGELGGRKKLVEVGAGWIVKLFEQCVEGGLVTRGQANRDVELVGWGQSLDRLEVEMGDRGRHLAAEELPRCCTGQLTDHEQADNGGAREYMATK